MRWTRFVQICGVVLLAAETLLQFQPGPHPQLPWVIAAAMIGLHEAMGYGGTHKPPSKRKRKEVHDATGTTDLKSLTIRDLEELLGIKDDDEASA